MSPPAGRLLHNLVGIISPYFSSSTSHEVGGCHPGVELIIFHQFTRGTHVVCDEDAVVEPRHVICLLLVEKEILVPMDRFGSKARVVRGNVIIGWIGGGWLIRFLAELVRVQKQLFYDCGETVAVTLGGGV